MALCTLWKVIIVLLVYGFSPFYSLFYIRHTEWNPLVNLVLAEAFHSCFHANHFIKRFNFFSVHHLWIPKVWKKWKDYTRAGEDYWSDETSCGKSAEREWGSKEGPRCCDKWKIIQSRTGKRKTKGISLFSCGFGLLCLPICCPDTIISS